MKMNKKQPNRWSLLLSAALCATPAFAVAANSEIAQVESRQQASKTCMGTAAALEDQALPALHSPQIVRCDLLHFYIPPICITGPISSAGAAGAS